MAWKFRIQLNLISWFSVCEYRCACVLCCAAHPSALPNHHNNIARSYTISKEDCLLHWRFDEKLTLTHRFTFHIFHAIQFHFNSFFTFPFSWIHSIFLCLWGVPIFHPLTYKSCENFYKVHTIRFPCQWYLFDLFFYYLRMKRIEFIFSINVVLTK